MNFDRMIKTKLDKWGCTCVFINKENKMLLGLRNKPDDLPQWSFPGGKVELGENPMQAVIREAKEECNLELIEFNYVGIILLNRVYDYIFVCREFNGEIKAQEEEMKDFTWYTKEEIKELPLFQYTKETIRLLEDKKEI